MALKGSSECCKKDFRGPKVMSELSKGSKNFLGDAVMTFCFLGLRINLIKTNVVSFICFSTKTTQITLFF